MAICFVFTPDDPEIYTLNPSAWLILELCKSAPEADIVTAYRAALQARLSRHKAQREVRAGIESLLQKGIIEVVGARHDKRARPCDTRKGGSSRDQKKPTAQR